MATITRFETTLREAEKLAVVTVLHAHPEWTLDDLHAYLIEGGPRAATLRGLTLRELLTPPRPSQALPDEGPPVDVRRLERAKRATGEEFDRYLAEVIAEAGRPVRAGYLRARVGGPRWKLQPALGRLAAAGSVVRTGSTSATRYRFVELS